MPDSDNVVPVETAEATTVATDPAPLSFSESKACALALLNRLKPAPGFVPDEIYAAHCAELVGVTEHQFRMHCLSYVPQG